MILSPSNGAASGTFPLIDNGFVTQESDGDLLYSANGYVETVSSTGKVLSTFGASHIEGNDVHTGSGQQFYYPAQAVQGPDGTIYTADPLYTMEATSPAGLLEGSTTLGGTLDFGGWNFALVGDTFYFQSGPPFDGGADAISSFSLIERRRLPRRHPGAVGQAGLGGGTRHPGHRQLLRRRDDADRRRHVRPLVDLAGRPPRAVVLGGERCLPDRRDGAHPHRRGPADDGHGPRLGAARPAECRHRPGALRGPGLAARHLDVPTHDARDDLHALHRGRRRRPSRLRHPPVRFRLRWPGRPPGRRPHLPARPHRTAQPDDHRLELGAARLQCVGPDGRHLRGLRPHLRRVEHRPLQGGLRGRPGPRGLLDPGERR